MGIARYVARNLDGVGIYTTRSSDVMEARRLLKTSCMCVMIVMIKFTLEDWMLCETCIECKHSRWLVGVGQGFRCAHPDNKYRRFTEFQEEREMPVIPNRKWLCERFQVIESEVVLKRLIFRLQNEIMDGNELDVADQELLDYYTEKLRMIQEDE
jgi:hypothetical protein